MTISLFNTLTKQKDPFVPLDVKNVRMYVCGPTVYDRAHIGNARAVVVFDILYRMLRDKYGTSRVTYARNITDVDDKINAAAKERDVDISLLTQKTIEMFHEDMADINCLLPNMEPKATEHIDSMRFMCEQLIMKEHAYEADGHVLFSVDSYPDYGKLSRRTTDEMIAGARVEVAPYKKNPADFVLWKPSKPDEPGWKSNWGRGRPGWHIECSAMSTKYLGETFDIHGGGVDLQFPHHENEIAQARCCYPGSEFARYWVHNGFLSVDGAKMSKSLGNFITVRDLLDRGVPGEVIRYVLLATHYRKPLDWNEKSINDAKKALDKFYKVIVGVKKAGDVNQEVTKALHDDMNTPVALAQLHKLADSGDGESLKASAAMVGLLQQNPEHWQASSSVEVTADVQALIDARQKARKEKNFAEADRIRKALLEQGIVLEDKPDGSTVVSG